MSRIISFTLLLANVLAVAATFEGAISPTLYSWLGVASAVVAAFNRSVLSAFNEPAASPDVGESVQALVQSRSQITQQAIDRPAAAIPSTKNKSKWLSIIGIVSSVAGTAITAVNPGLGALVTLGANAAASTGPALRK